MTWRCCAPTASPLAITITIDSTFRAAYKATIVSKDGTRCKHARGGIETVLNDDNQIISWVSTHLSLRLPLTHKPSLYSSKSFLDDQANSSVERIIQGLARRFALLGIDAPEMAIADNCCHVKNALVKVFPRIRVCLDVWHFMMRYVLLVLLKLAT